MLIPYAKIAKSLRVRKWRQIVATTGDQSWPYITNIAGLRALMGLASDILLITKVYREDCRCR